MFSFCVTAVQEDTFHFNPIDWDQIERTHEEHPEFQEHDFTKESLHAEQAIIDEGSRDAKAFDIEGRAFLKQMMEMKASAIQELQGEHHLEKGVDLVPKLRKLKLR